MVRASKGAAILELVLRSNTNNMYTYIVIFMVSITILGLS